MTSLQGVKVFLARVACSTRNICVKSADTEISSTESTCTGGACTRTASIGYARGVSGQSAAIGNTSARALVPVLVPSNAQECTPNPFES